MTDARHVALRPAPDVPDPTETMKSFTHAMGAMALLFAATVLPASAQSIAGQAVETETGAPLAGFPVWLSRVAGDSLPPGYVDSARTDPRGLFEFVRVRPGIYQLEFGMRGSPLSRGPIDTVSALAVPPRRRYEVPVAASVRDLPPASASAPDIPPRARSPHLRIGAATLLGTALGAGAGYAMSAVRCGRTPSCVPTKRYPYTPAGAVLGAGFGGGLAAEQAGCRYGLARGIVGSLVGSLAGSLLVRDDGQQQRAAASAGGVVGSLALTMTCGLGAR